MHTITFTCETITPMFLSGADGQTPELRAPSIKGALRFWWRALNGHLSLEELKQKEGEIFGSTDRRSKVIIRVKQPQGYSSISGRKMKDKKLDYLFFSFLHHMGDSMGYPENITFEVSFKSKSKLSLYEFSKAFWLLTYLGGLGTRARRGAGAFTVINVMDDEKFLDKWGVSFKINNLDAVFIKNLRLNSKGEPLKQQYSVLTGSEVYFSNEAEDYFEDVLGEVEDVLLDMRVNEEFTLNTLDQKAAFGLPIMVRYPRSKSWELNLQNNERRASPLFISAYLDSNGLYRWVVTHLQGDFMPPNDKIQLRNPQKHIKKSWDEPNNSLLYECLNELEIKGNKITL